MTIQYYEEKGIPHSKRARWRLTKHMARKHGVKVKRY